MFPQAAPDWGLISYLETDNKQFFHDHVLNDPLCVCVCVCVCVYVYVYNLNSYYLRVEWLLPGAGRWGKWRDVDQRVKTFSYKMNKIWESNVQHVDYS